MVTVDEAIIARYVKSGKTFEILVDSELAYAFREGKNVSIQKMLVVNGVFSDSKKGLKSSPVDLMKEFGTTDIGEITGVIVKKGEVQLTTEFRRKKTEEKRKQIAEFISKNGINPQTKTPHPQDRILSAMEHARVSIDPLKPVEKQIEDVIKAIKPIIPLSFEEIMYNVAVPAQYSGRAYGIIKEFSSKKENWLSDGSIIAVISIPGGLRDIFFRRMNEATSGNVKIEEIK